MKKYQEKFTIVRCIGGWRTVPVNLAKVDLLAQLWDGHQNINNLIPGAPEELDAVIGNLKDVSQQNGLVLEPVGNPGDLNFALSAKERSPKYDLSVFEHGDGAHCGLSDWYDDKEAALKAALESGLHFDTGWYGSKKEIASARISSDGEKVWIEVSVSDDFDTEGRGETTIPAPATLEQVAQAIGAAWNEAESDQKDNREYCGYSLIHHSTKIPEWRKGPTVFPQETRKRYPRKVPQCLDYLIVPAGTLYGDIADRPPGDNYFFWGWQNDSDHESDEDCGKVCVEEGIPKKTVEAFEAFANRQESGSLRIGDWEIRAWDEE